MQSNSYLGGKKMKFHFKTLEQQVKESGFKYLGRFHSFVDDESRVFNEHVMKELAEHLLRLTSLGDRYKALYLEVRSNRDGGLRGYEIEVFGAE
jgi:hypothetical protein